MLQKTPDRIKRNKMEENLNEKLGLDKGTYWGPFLHRSHCGTNLKSCTVYRKMKHNTRSCTTYLGPFCLRRVYKKLIGWSLMVRKDQQGYAQAGWWGVLKGGIMSFPTASRSPWRWKVLSRSDSLVLIHWTMKLPNLNEVTLNIYSNHLCNQVESISNEERKASSCVDSSWTLIAHLSQRFPRSWLWTTLCICHLIN